MRRTAWKRPSVLLAPWRAKARPATRFPSSIGAGSFGNWFSCRMGGLRRRKFAEGRPPPSALRWGQPERLHLLVVAHQQDVAGQRRVVPGLALQRRVPRQLPELLRRRRDQRQLALLRQHQQQVLVGEQDHLAVAVAFPLPLLLAVREVDAGEDAAVEAEGV